MRIDEESTQVDKEVYCQEVYRLTLSHYMERNGERIELEEPFVVNMVYDRRYGNVAVCLNMMIDKMRHELVRMKGVPE